MLEAVAGVVFWIFGAVMECILGVTLASVPSRVWVSLGLVALGLAAIAKSSAGLGPTHEMLLFLTGIGLVLSPVALFMWPDPPR